MTDTGPDPSNSAGAHGSGDAPGLAASLAGLLDGYARIMSQIAGGPVEPGDTDDETGVRQVDVPAAAIEAATIATTSSTRYAQRLTELFAKHQGTVTGALPGYLSKDGPTPQQCRENAEVFRRFLREIGEAAQQEARLLDRELQQLGEAVAQGAAPDPSDDALKRRHKITP